MKCNQNVKIEGCRIVLVPYRRCHVEQYHEWMKDKQTNLDPENLELTASEPLSLEEEYEMQRKWREDEDKCTFIILDKTSLGQSAAPSKEGYESQEERKDQEEIAGMVGDVNLFLVEGETGLAELEIMLGDRRARGKGLGKEGAALMMRYAKEDLHLERIRVKIGRKNSISIRMFEKFGFSETEISEVFDEVTMELNLLGENETLSQNWKDYSKCDYSFCDSNDSNVR